VSTQNTVPENAHNHLLQTAVTLGIPAALLAYGALLWALLASARGLVGQPRGGRRNYFFVGLWAAVASFAINIQVDPSLVASQAIWWVLIGTLLATRATRRATPAPAPRGLVSIVGILLATVLIVVAAVVVAADHELLVSRVRRYYDSGDRLAPIETAIRLNPLHSEYRKQLADLRYDQLVAAIQSGGDAQAAYALADEAASQAANHRPADRMTHFNRLRVYLAAARDVNDPEMSRKIGEALAGSLAADSMSYDARLKAGKAYAAAGDSSMARTVLSALLRDRPEYAAAKAELGRLPEQ